MVRIVMVSPPIVVVSVVFMKSQTFRRIAVRCQSLPGLLRRRAAIWSKNRANVQAFCEE